MTQNVGGIDRILRIIVGVALLVWGFVLNAEPVWWAAIGAVPLLTGLISWCPAYSLLGGISTKK
jgi:sulfite exporter TauE/SafE